MAVTATVPSGYTLNADSTLSTEEGVVGFPITDLAGNVTGWLDRNGDLLAGTTAAGGTGGYDPNQMPAGWGDVECWRLTNAQIQAGAVCWVDGGGYEHFGYSERYGNPSPSLEAYLSEIESMPSAGGAAASLYNNNTRRLEIDRAGGFKMGSVDWGQDPPSAYVDFAKVRAYFSSGGSTVIPVSPPPSSTGLELPPAEPVYSIEEEVIAPTPAPSPTSTPSPSVPVDTYTPPPSSGVPGTTPAPSPVFPGSSPAPLPPVLNVLPGEPSPAGGVPIVSSDAAGSGGLLVLGGLALAGFFLMKGKGNSKRKR